MDVESSCMTDSTWRLESTMAYKNKKMKFNAKDGFSGRTAIDIVEESFNILRQNWKELLPLHMIGMVPFVAGLVLFVNDMSFSVLAFDKAGEYSFMMVLLFMWKNFIQSLFCRKVTGKLIMSEADGEPFDLRATVKIFVSQGIVQTAGLFIRFISLILFVTIPLTSAFFNSFAVFIASENGDIRKSISKSFRHMLYMLHQNCFLQVIFFCVGLMTAVNAVTIIFAISWFIKTFLGMESTFSLGSSAIYFNIVFNTTFLSVLFGIVLLVVDPIVKTAFTVRVFYEESATKGYDIIADFARISGSMLSRHAVSIAMVLSVFLTLPAAAAGNTIPLSADSTGTVSPIPPEEIRSSLDKVLKERQFSWHMPPVEEMKENPAGIWLTIERYLEKVKEFMDEVLEFLGGYFFKKGGERTWKRLVGENAVLISIVLAAAAVAVFLLIYFLKRNRAKRHAAVAVAGIARKIAIEDISADKHDDSEWARMALDFIAGGDMKSALRAFFMACLSTLSTKNILVLNRAKTNSDYYRELRRKMRRRPEIASVFHENLIVFEKVCYGKGDVDAEVLESFRKNYELLKGFQT